jgi:hypothetical protein
MMIPMPSSLRQLTPLPFTQIHLHDSFWSPRQAVNRQKTLPHIYQMLQQTGRISAFDLDFERPIPSPIVLIFGDSDPAKWLEAACYSLATHPDSVLSAQVEDFASRVIRAQAPDGYLNTHFLVTQPEMRWKNLRDWHELYCAGHLIEGAVAHFQATGDPKLLDALCRYADHIDAAFGPQPGMLRGYCGHPEIELALVKLSHATSNQRYLELAKYFIEERGAQPHYYDWEARQRGEDPASFWAKNYEYCQAHLPIRQQEKVVGHAVRAMYLFSAVADLAHEYNDPTLLQTCERLWENLVTRRIYLTGGIGPSRHNEGFTQDYDLPDDTAYAETCATIGLILWNHRLLQFSGDRKYADVLERGLYNGFLSGISLEGAHFFYENPLASAGNHHRVPWFACPCCPPNVARLVASIDNYFYSTSPQGVWVHQFASNEAQMTVSGTPFLLKQSSNYPWDGVVQLQVLASQPVSFDMHLRLPGWCQAYQLSLNGKSLEAAPQANGYIAISRTWQESDTLTYEMDMPIRPVFANPAVQQLQGRVALQRGPLVYCLEGADHPGIPLGRISVNPEQVSREFTAEFKPELLGGVTVLQGRGHLLTGQDWGSTLYRSQPPQTEEIPLTFVPYCVWDNRTPSEMRVWLRAGNDSTANSN